MNYKIVPTCQINHEYLNNLYLKIFGYKKEGVFVECGAYDGVTFSNTYGLSEAGWSGLYIEPVEEFLNACKLNNKLNLNHKFFNCAVSNFRGSTKLFLGDWGTTICSHLVTDNHPYLNRKRFRMIDVYPLDYILEFFDISVDFDLLVIDTEGNDLKVLEGFSIHKYIPKMIIVEYTHETFDEFVKYFSNYNYRLENKDSCNLIYLRNDLCQE